MKINILFINFESNLTPLVPFFKELLENDCSLFFLSYKKSGVENFDNFKKLSLPKLNLFAFYILLPFLFIFYFFLIAYYKYKKNITHIACFDYKETMISFFPSKIFKIKNIWLELPGKKYKKNKKISGLAKFFLKKTDIIVFTSKTQNDLEKTGIKERFIKRVGPGIKLKSQCHQENIFFKIAKAKKADNLKKFFTIGTVVDLESKQKIELLFHAIKKCLTVIPQLQFIVVGEGKERKNLSWLAKKIEIDNLVWFVGEQAFLKKWLENFDIYAVVCETPNLKDINLTLEAASSGLPIVSPDNIGFEEFVSLNQNGAIIESDSSEILAQEIIRLYKDKILRKKLGQNSQKMVDDFYTIDKMAESFIKIINN